MTKNTACYRVFYGEIVKAMSFFLLGCQKVNIDTFQPSTLLRTREDQAGVYNLFKLRSDLHFLQLSSEQSNATTADRQRSSLSSE